MIHHVSLIVVCFVCVCSIFSSFKAKAANPNLWLMGDSTVRNGNGEGVGWGDVVHEYFDLSQIQVRNRAIGARSSRSYYREGRFDAILNQEGAQAGDYLIMQFGHNDGGIVGNSAYRRLPSLQGVGDETQMVTYDGITETVHTFGWYLRQYVQGALDAGLTPIVASYVPRAPRQGQTLDPTLSAYGLWAQQVAEQEEVAFLNLYGLIGTHYAELESVDPHIVKESYFVGGDRDYTHTNLAGAHLNAHFVAEGILNLEGQAGELGQYLTVPEPSAGLLVILSGLGICKLRRR